MLPVVVTLILIVTSFEINGNDGFLTYRQNRQTKSSRWMRDECTNRIDEVLVTFFKAFEVNHSRITRNILLLRKMFVSVFFKVIYVIRNFLR